MTNCIIYPDPLPVEYMNRSLVWLADSPLQFCSLEEPLAENYEIVERYCQIEPFAQMLCQGISDLKRSKVFCGRTQQIATRYPNIFASKSLVLSIESRESLIQSLQFLKSDSNLAKIQQSVSPGFAESYIAQAMVLLVEPGSDDQVKKQLGEYWRRYSRVELAVAAYIAACLDALKNRSDQIAINNSFISMLYGPGGRAGSMEVPIDLKIDQIANAIGMISLKPVLDAAPSIESICDVRLERQGEINRMKLWFRDAAVDLANVQDPVLLSERIQRVVRRDISPEVVKILQLDKNSLKKFGWDILTDPKAWGFAAVLPFLPTSIGLTTALVASASFIGPKAVTVNLDRKKMLSHSPASVIYYLPK